MVVDDYEPSDGTWILGTKAKLLHELRSEMSTADYESSKRSLQNFLCNYFNSGDCNNAQGKSICPLKKSPKGGKVLKVRWALPGRGKRESLRLVVVVYCEKKRVQIAQAFIRRDDPSDKEILDSVADY